MQIYQLSEQELKQIKSLLLSCCQQLFFESANFENNSLLNQISVLAHQLPLDLKDFLIAFKYKEEEEGVCVVKGYKVDEEKIEQTPKHWRDEGAERRTKEESLFLMLCASLLGDPIAWSSQQEGALIHNIVPIKGDEYKQVGSSTLTDLWWHTEEAFHPYRCDYIGLFCLRNNEKASTTYAGVNSISLADQDKKALFCSDFTIYPDLTHLSLDHQSNKQMVQCQVIEPTKVPVLFGDFDSPYLCIDPFYMQRENLPIEAETALKNIILEINRNLKSAVLEQGDLLFIDNYRAVHGRAAFAADFGGTGRWLKRVNVVRDLRKSRSMRSSAGSRIIQNSHNDE